MATVILPGTFYVGSYGQVLQIAMKRPDTGDSFPVPQDSRYSLIFQTPDRRTLVVAAQLATDGLDGVLQYVIPRGFLNHVGTWSVQAKVETATSVDYSDPLIQFTVSQPLG
ncbi:MAG: hypothetical protein IPH13_20535 [Planctomycetes bacterium]|nr:hypothetical protein [Planctomycetota bacterium]